MHTPVSEKILITMYVLPKKVEDLSKVGYEQGINDNLHIFLNVKSLKAIDRGDYDYCRVPGTRQMSPLEVGEE